MAITTADVHATADALAAAGKKPTLAAIRAALGTGSYSTIGEAMKSWEKTAAPQAPAATTPQAVTDRAAEMAAQVWAVAQELAEQRMQAERQEMAAQRQEMEAQRTEATELADTMAAELDSARAEIEKARTELDELRKAAAVQATKLESIADRIAHAEQQAKEARAAEIEAREAAAELRGKLEASKPAGKQHKGSAAAPAIQPML